VDASTYNVVQVIHRRAAHGCGLHRAMATPKLFFIFRWAPKNGTKKIMPQSLFHPIAEIGKYTYHNHDDDSVPISELGRCV